MMDEELIDEAIGSLNQMEQNLTKATTKQDEISQLLQNFFNVNPPPMSTIETTKSVIKATLSMYQCLEKISPHLQKFNTKILYASKEKVIQDPQTNQPKIEITNNQTYIHSQLQQRLGIFEQAVVQQIEIIDSQKKECTYQDNNQILSERIYYTNKVIDSCAQYLIKNL